VDVDVAVAWRRITTWLASNAPVTAAAIRPPAGAAELDRTGETVGRPLPEDLLAWWRLMDGIDETDYRAGFPIPSCYQPLPVAGVRDSFTSLARFADEECCAADGTHATAAGDPLFGYCTATVPICRDLAGDVLVVDLRDGAARGCVMGWMAEDGYVPTGWDTPAAMLADVADRLDNPAHVEVVDAGVLQWR
jgi:cell wall assembly regulator SMI1